MKFLNGDVSVCKPNPKKFIIVTLRELELYEDFTYREQEYYFRYLEIYKCPSLVPIQS